MSTSSSTLQPRVVPLSKDLASQVVLFKPPRRSFVLHNAKKKEVETMYVGNLMTIPAVNVVNKYRSDRDSDGDWIPGTYVIEDLYCFDEKSGDEVLILDAARAVAHILGVQKAGTDQSAVATSPHAIAGLSLLPRHAPKELIRAVVEGGSHLAFLSEVQNARNLVESVAEVNSKRKSLGLDPIPGGYDYTKAVALMNEYDKLVQAEIQRETQPTMDASADSVIDEEIEMMAIARAKALELVESVAAGKMIDKEKLLAELLNDPKVRQYAQKEYRFRKRGRQPIAPEELEAAAAAGLTVADVEKNQDQETETE